MTADTDTRQTAKGVPTYDRQRLAIATDLLADVVPKHTVVSLFGFRLERRAVGNVWRIYDADGNPVDAVNLEATAKASDLLDHLAGLREARDEAGQ